MFLFVVKVLTAEAAKIYEQIQENCDTFEQILIQLHRRRMLAQTAVIQVDLLKLNEIHTNSFFFYYRKNQRSVVSYSL